MLGDEGVAVVDVQLDALATPLGLARQRHRHDVVPGGAVLRVLDHERRLLVQESAGGAARCLA